jgi:hypothetical protein
MHSNRLHDILAFAGITLLACACAAFLTFARAESAPPSEAQSWLLTQSAAHGFKVRPGNSRLYLFVDPECSVCHQALAQAVKLPENVTVVPLGIYAAWRIEESLLPMAKANNEVFHAIRRPFLPMWIGLDACSKPTIILGTLNAQDQQRLADAAACEGDSQKGKRPNLDASVFML